MDDATRNLVTRRWNEYGLDNLQPRDDPWSGQAPPRSSGCCDRPSAETPLRSPRTLVRTAFPRPKASAE